MTQNENLKKNGMEIISKLIDNGYQGYFVGGFIRDIILKHKINDIDIATDAHPEKVMSIFSKVIPTGLKHGTVTVIINNLPFEVTTFRTESKYLDYRRPDRVYFVSTLVDDLRRRDFTINAMAMSIDEKIIDPFNGQADIENRIIKTVGSADERFTEDPLRMLRAIRFAAQLNFTIEENTWNSILKNASLIQYIANQRIKSELIKIINSANPELGIDLFIKSNMINWIKGLKKPSIFNTTFLTEKLLSKTDDLVIRITILLNFLCISDYKSLMRQLRFSNMEITNINRLYSAIELFQLDNYNSLKAALIKTDIVTCQKAIEFLYIMGALNLSQMEQLLHKLTELDSTLTVRNSNDLVITGRDLIDVFHKPGGPWLSRVLDILTHKVQYEGLPNEYNLLIKAAKDILQKEIEE